VNEKGEGKLTFMSYFHTFPDSVAHFFDDAIVVVVLHPQGKFNEQGLQDYNMIGYIHANIIHFKDADGNVREGYYYNVLRMSEATVEGEAIYRRKRIFTTSVQHSAGSYYHQRYSFCICKHGQGKPGNFGCP
jgi:hypothetical protein